MPLISRKMVKHIVTFKLNGDPQTRRRVASEFASALMALPEKIDVLSNMEVGINSNPDEDWDIVLTATVDTMEEVGIYARHPDHLAAAQSLPPTRQHAPASTTTAINCVASIPIHRIRLYLCNFPSAIHLAVRTNTALSFNLK